VIASVLALGASLVPRGSSATVEQQRARLPPAASCQDNVEGTWLALKYEPQWREWYEYTLVIRRKDPKPEPGTPGPIEGEILSHYWVGSDSDEKPPACSPGRREIIVRMPGTGKVDAAGNLAFGSSSYTIDKAVCGAAGRYNPDNFSGKIDADRQEFQSVNNDGGRAVNDPTVFRRVRCLDAPHRGTGTAKPPAFAPVKRRSWSCGR